MQLARRDSSTGFPSIFSSLRPQKGSSSLEQLHYPLESLLNVINLNLALLCSLREGTLPGLQLPFLLYDFYLKFQTALAASDLASWSLVILAHVLVLSTNDGVHLLILHFNSMNGFPQRDDPQLDRLIDTLFVEAHFVSRRSSPGWSLLGLLCWSLQLRPPRDRYQLSAFLNYRLLEQLTGWLLFGYFRLPGPNFAFPFYAHYLASLCLFLLSAVDCCMPGRGSSQSSLPLSDSALDEAITKQELLREVSEQVRKKAD